jgi:ABC-type multidrug transport system ATPase subunit
MIEARNLVKRYGSTMAVNDLSFSIRELAGGLVRRGW